MIQLRGRSIVKPLKSLFESSVTGGIFPEDWKKDKPTKKEKQELLKEL